MQKISLLEIYKIFFIIGFQLLGGGYVILPLLQKYIVDERKWITEEELIADITECRRQLNLLGSYSRGFAYPEGATNSLIMRELQKLHQNC